MSELQELKNELQQINNEQIRLRTLIEQAKTTCSNIEHKYSVTNENELRSLLEQKQREFEEAKATAKEYIDNAKQMIQECEALL